MFEIVGHTHINIYIYLYKPRTKLADSNKTSSLGYPTDQRNQTCIIVAALVNRVFKCCYTLSPSKQIIIYELNQIKFCQISNLA